MADDVNQVFSDLSKLSPDDYVKQLGFEGPEAVMAKKMIMDSQAQQQAQQKYAGLVDQQYNQLAGQTGMDPYTKASLMFQAAGALAAPTRSGGFGESLGALGSQLAGPLMQQAQAERSRQDKLQQLQLARAKMATEMQSGPDMGKMLQLVKSQRDNEDEGETFTSTKTTDPRTGAEIPFLVGTRGTVKPVDLKGIGAGEAVAPVGEGLTGEDYLDALKESDAALAAKVKAIAEGRMAMPSVSSRNKAEAKRITDAVAQYDPEGINDITSGVRRKVATGFTSGKDAADVSSLNTVIKHLTTLKDSAERLDNSSIPMYNEVSNAAITAAGKSAVTDFNLRKKAVADELSRVLKGQATEGEVKRWNEAINSSMSPDQLNDAISSAIELMEGRMSSLGEKYEAGMNYKVKTDGGLKLLSEEAQKKLEALKSNPIKGSEKYNQMQKQKRTAASQQRQAPAEDQQASPSPDGQGWVVRNGVRIRLKPGQE
jgi:hypothetical protein